MIDIGQNEGAKQHVHMTLSALDDSIIDNVKKSLMNYLKALKWKEAQ